ncbi:tRNA dimethylallyltransferase [Synchytrium endobioticum]|nr:tRNA dimethylallyltransferase [Synchytrium endobioticum]
MYSGRKSKLSIELAKAIGGEIINADSMQVYRGLDVVTNKIPEHEREGIPHHLMDVVDWEQEYSVIDFTRDALAKIADMHSRNVHPILVGGTHYYIQSLLWKNMLIADANVDNKQPHPSLSEDDRSLIEPFLEDIDAGQSAMYDARMYEVLRELDPVMAERWHPNDARKVRRSLEVFYTTGRRHSDWLEEQRQSNLQDESAPTIRFPSCVFWVYAEPSVLGRRLDDRVDLMIKEGMFDELRNMMRLWQSSNTKDTQPDYTRGIFQTIGFKEFNDYLVSLSSEHLVNAERLVDEGIQAMKIATRQYARRQTHWIRNRLGPRVFDERKRGGRFGFYALDATDLSQWDATASQTAIGIAKQFLDWTSDLPAASPLLQQLIPEINPQASLSVTEWKKFTCDVCLDANGQFRVLNGPSEWEAHLKSRIHRKRVDYIKNDLDNDGGSDVGGEELGLDVMEDGTQ